MLNYFLKNNLLVIHTNVYICICHVWCKCRTIVNFQSDLMNVSCVLTILNIDLGPIVSDSDKEISFKESDLV